MHRFLVLGALCLLAGCQPAPEAPQTPAAAVGAPVTAGAITVEQAAARPPLGGQTTGAGYFVIRNNGDAPDRLIGAASPVAATVELHTHRDDNGVLRMERLEAVDVPARGAVVFAPRGLHLMLFDFRPAGDTAPVTLRFEMAGEVAVDFAVAPLGAGAAGDHDH